MKTKIYIALLLFSIIHARLPAQEDKIATMAQGFPAQFTGSLDERHLISKESGIIYELNIYLPRSYNVTQKKYPVMILTDAVLFMGIARSVFDCLTIFQDIPEVIVVGIGYPFKDGLDWTRCRFRDMTPTHAEGFDPSGSADKFIAFIKNDLFSFLENNYRIDSTDRCFTGASLGGLLGSHILIEQPHLFKRYIIGSPSYWWNHKEMTTRLSAKSAITSDSISVYTYIGGQEGIHVKNWREFNELLKSKSGANLKFRDQLFPDDNHMSASPTAFAAAVRFIYGK